jgi:hypothetical protein
LSNTTALRDETVLRRVRHLGSARYGLRQWRLAALLVILFVLAGLAHALPTAHLHGNGKLV